MRDEVVPRSGQEPDVIAVERTLLERWLCAFCPGYRKGTLRPCYTKEIRTCWMADFTRDSCAVRFKTRYLEAFAT